MCKDEDNVVRFDVNGVILLNCGEYAVIFSFVSCGTVPNIRQTPILINTRNINLHSTVFSKYCFPFLHG